MTRDPSVAASRMRRAVVWTTGVAALAAFAFGAAGCKRAGSLVTADNLARLPYGTLGPRMPVDSDGVYFGDKAPTGYSSSNPEWKSAVRARAVCLTVKSRRPSKAVVKDALSHPAPANCSPMGLYYGMNGRLRDVVAARRCAVPKMDGKAAGGAPLVLMNIYANGDGVPRDLDLATRFACGLDAAEAEVQLRTDHLVALEARPGGRFDFCDDITSGRAGGDCADIEAGRKTTVRMTREAALTVGWTTDQMRGLYRLHEAETAFGEAHGSEQDLSGTLRGAFFIANQEEIRDFDAALLDRMAKGSVARFSAASLAKADADLNRAYQQALKTQIQEPTEYDSNPDPSEKDIRETQRAWIVYRDAWTALAHARSPAAADGVTLAVIRERTRQIKAIGLE